MLSGTPSCVIYRFTSFTCVPRHHALWLFFRSEFLEMFSVLRIISKIIVKISLKYPKLRTLKIMITWELPPLKMSWTCGFLCPNKKHHLVQCIFVFLSPGVLLKHQNQSPNCHSSLSPYFYSTITFHEKPIVC